jgi:hypothetical protein
MLTKNVRLVLALTAATPLLFAACKDNNLVTPANVVGSYQLTLFRGQVPPVTDTYQASDGITDLPNGGTVSWTGGTFVLDADGGFAETNTYTITPTGEASRQSAFTSIGTYRLSGSSIIFTAPAQNNNAARNFTGTITVKSIAYQESDGQNFLVFEYRR